MKTLLNVLLMSAIFALPMVTYAAPATPPAPKADDAAQLEKIKAVKQQGIDARIKVFQDEKVCVQAVTSKEGLHACEKTATDALDKIKDQQKANWNALKKDKVAKK